MFLLVYFVKCLYFLCLLKCAWSNENENNFSLKPSNLNELDKLQGNSEPEKYRSIESSTVSFIRDTNSLSIDTEPTTIASITTTTSTKTVSSIKSNEILHIIIDWIFENNFTCDLIDLFQYNIINPICDNNQELISFEMYYGFSGTEDMGNKTELFFLPFDLNFDVLKKFWFYWYKPDSFNSDKNILVLFWKDNEFKFIASNCTTSIDECMYLFDHGKLSAVLKFEDDTPKINIFNRTLNITFENDIFTIHEPNITFKTISINGINFPEDIIDNKFNISNYYPYLFGYIINFNLTGYYDLKSGLDDGTAIGLGLDAFKNVSHMADDGKQTIIFDFMITENTKLALFESPFNIIRIPYKSEIVSIKKINSTTVDFEWSDPLGEYDSFILKCTIEDSVYSFGYPKTARNGYCSYLPSLGGYWIAGTISVILNLIQFESPEFRYLIEPNPVSFINLIRNSSNFLEISWTAPLGLVDMYDVIETNYGANWTHQNVYTYSNTTFTHLSTNLKANVTYYFQIFTIRGTKSIAGQPFSFTTSPCESFDCNLDDLLNLPDEQLIDILNDKINETVTLANIDRLSFIFNELANKKNNSEVMLKLMDLGDNLIDQVNNDLNVDLKNRLSQGLETAVNKINVDNLDNNEYSKNYLNFYVKSKKVNRNFLIGDIGFFLHGLSNQDDIDDDNFLNIDDFKYDAYIDKNSILELVNKGIEPKISFIGYTSSKLFKSYDTSKKCKNTNVLSNNVISAYVNQNILFINIIFAEKQFDKKCSNAKYKYDCSYWDYSKNDWNNYGCTHLEIKNETKIVHKCVCNHTTNFAMLLIFDGFTFDPPWEKALIYTSYFGIGLSILGLLLTIGTNLFIAILPSNSYKKFNRPEMAIYKNMTEDYLRVFTCWCISLLLMNASYIVFSTIKFNNFEIERSYSSKNTCNIIGPILHYFLISSFCFSFCITLINYVLTTSLNTYRFILIKSLAFSLLIPLVIVLLFQMKTEPYVNSNGYCWLNRSDALFGVLLPILMLIGFNIILFAFIRKGQQTHNQKRKKYFHIVNDEDKFLKKEIILVILSFVNSSATWAFGLLVTIPNNNQPIRYVFALIFCLLNSTQGFQIFYVYLIVSKGRRKILEEKIKNGFQMVLSKR